jgi:hypothetical protein
MGWDSSEIAYDNIKTFYHLTNLRGNRALLWQQCNETGLYILKMNMKQDLYSSEHPHRRIVTMEMCMRQSRTKKLHSNYGRWIGLPETKKTVLFYKI